MKYSRAFMSYPIPHLHMHVLPSLPCQNHKYLVAYREVWGLDVLNYMYMTIYADLTGAD